MSYRRVKFEYYHVVYRKKEDGNNVRDRLFDLAEWLEKAQTLSLEGRTYDYMSEQARLDRGYFDEELGFYFLHFVRLRDTNIPSKAKLESEVEPFELEEDEFLGEEVSALYDDEFHVLMLQRNKYSLGPEGIQDYLNLVWDNDDEHIMLKAICPNDIFEFTGGAKEYRRIHLSFADLKLHKNRGLIGKLKSPIRNIVSSFNEFEGVNAQVVITVGKIKNESLNKEAVSDVMLDIKQNREMFSKAEIAKKDNDETRVELVDLFEHKVHDFVTFRMEKRESLNHFSVAYEMWKIYGDQFGCGDRRSYIRKLINIE